MARSALEKFRSRLALTAYFRHLFGISDPGNNKEVSNFYNDLDRATGESSDGTSNVYHFVAARLSDSPLTDSELLRYERSVERHIGQLNEHRTVPIRFKPFQRLACLMTEAYLDRVSNNQQKVVDELNAFVREQNAEKGRIKYPRFERSDLNKLALWMATGSGKTLLMHVNYYQYLDYADGGGSEPDNILLITPNEGLSSQHLEKMRRSGIPGYSFNAETAGLWSGAEHPVKVIEIHKLTSGKSSEEGLSIPVRKLEGRNLVFVDEAHKGIASDAQTWVGYREALASRGFTFEYSAAFGHSLGSEKVDVQEEYGKSVIFDYSYPRFHEDGYGKDYEILNLSGKVPQELRDRYLLGNLLAFYQQVYVFRHGPDELRREFNIRHPLLVFIGHSVNAGRTSSSLTKPDQKSLSDVEEVLSFLARVIRNANGDIGEDIDRLLAGDSGLTDTDGSDLFEGRLSALKKTGLNGQELYAAMLRDLFHTEAPARLVLDNITAAQGEIGLRVRGADRPFGVINIGNDRVFLDRAESQEPDITVRDDQFSDSLFRAISSPDSPVSILLGARKFIEGWDSWRVSSLGLMNFGRGEGPQIIQLFGRGVRLLGKDRSLKRTSALDGIRGPSDIETLETLRVFGVRADYMASFKEHLKKEGIEVSEKRTVTIPTKREHDFADRGLLVIRPDEDRVFDEEERFVFRPSHAPSPTIDLTPQLERISSREESGERADRSRQRVFPSTYIRLLDWGRLYKQLWHFRSSRGYKNMAVPKSKLRTVLEEEQYELYCPEEYLTVERIRDVQDKLEPVALAILRRSVEEYYEHRRRNFEQGTLEYETLESELSGESGNFPSQYEAEVEVNRAELLSELQQALKDEDKLYGSEDGLPSRVYFDKHLYLPLIAEEAGADDTEVTYRPPALNEGERSFVEELRDYLASERGDKLREGWEIYLLRNRARGHGIGFLSGQEHDERFFPDFILWLKNKDQQHIVFVEPHGLALEGEPLENHRVLFHSTIKDYERALSDGNNGEKVALHSYVISQTPYRDLRQRSRSNSRDIFHDHGVYFRGEDLGKLINDVLNGE